MTDAVRAGRPDQRVLLAVTLAGVAGFIDAVGYLTLDLFTAHMSGNSTRLGVYLGGGIVLRAAPAMFAVAVFVIAITVGTMLMEAGTRVRLRSPSAVVIGVEAALLLVFAVYGGVVATHGHVARGRTATYYGLAALAVVAMGLQTSTLQQISGRTVRTTYVSGMLTQLSDELAGLMLRRPMQRDEPSYLRAEVGVQPGRASGRRIVLVAGIWCVYAAGGILGGYLQHRWQLRCVAIPIAVLLAVAAIELQFPIDDVRRSRSRTTDFDDWEPGSGNG